LLALKGTNNTSFWGFDRFSHLNGENKLQSWTGNSSGNGKSTPYCSNLVKFCCDIIL